MSFITSLSFEQLQYLRKIVRNIHMIHMPDELATDREIDKVIDSIAPHTAEKLLEQSIRIQMEGNQ